VLLPQPTIRFAPLLHP